MLYFISEIIITYDTLNHGNFLQWFYSYRVCPLWRNFYKTDVLICFSLVIRCVSGGDSVIKRQRFENESEWYQLKDNRVYDKNRSWNDMFTLFWLTPFFIFEIIFVRKTVLIFGGVCFVLFSVCLILKNNFFALRMNMLVCDPDSSSRWSCRRESWKHSVQHRPELDSYPRG